MVSHDLLLGPDPQNELLPCSNAGEFVRCRLRDLTSVFSVFLYFRGLFYVLIKKKHCYRPQRFHSIVGCQDLAHPSVAKLALTVRAANSNLQASHRSQSQRSERTNKSKKKNCLYFLIPCNVAEWNYYITPCGNAPKTSFIQS